MKLNRSSRSTANQGSVLVVAIGTVIVLGIILAAILSLITQERRILTRTAAWNSALPAAEAGIEEAMSHLRQVEDGPRGVNGWAASGSSFVMTRTLTDSRYTVGINSASAPVILSVGEVWCPSANKYIQRRVQVTTTNYGRFRQGMVARRQVSAGGGFQSDSFDSSNPALSTNGQYDSTKRSDKGNIASNLSVPGAITLSGGVAIYGNVATGPTGTVVIATSATVGSETWVDGGNKGIEKDHYSADMNVSFPPADMPLTNMQTLLPNVAQYNGTNYKYVLQDGVDYHLSTLSLGSKEQLVVAGKARLLVDKDVDLHGKVIVPTNSSLEIYVAKGLVSSTSGGVFNESGYAANFSLIGLNGLTDISMSGGGNFIGTIYAPNATFKMTGGSEYWGALIVAEISVRGGFKFHYDEALAKKQPYYLAITSWVEL